MIIPVLQLSFEKMLQMRQISLSSIVFGSSDVLTFPAMYETLLLLI